ncbi:uncharacterized protein LOC129603759 [Betta splendens]|uniref:Uncharacterized protein LOC129603759 n=1 Tax=Betta splendens TaxID=158456 RepID=A0A9W2XM17_BETSP|nr:uncharacterized protein LOC129603759 [Betta splendens]XP_055362696.1 uncharacterized protein LOC129603759 [Betta splendens]XP_055362697.1 uncharacterized protein LOC129603759 [Betta splendens]XP_055362698.1 uncharacterized protein LOC129603759 [Betta splendens]XP_055362699.1 uncharacterized protein LOC129603759 [Betta splendens]XP_055362700.1 uncharacterized protein LOC129603759 [Betta splendens]XP_055362701.1 uncharacterized protein LOC129603759 [Betta splendens]XP_055362702.1 uncharacte
MQREAERAQVGIQTGSSLKRLQEMVRRYNLYHVKTLHYKDTRGVLDWLGAKNSNFTFGTEEDTVLVLERFLTQHQMRNVKIVGPYEEPEIEGNDRLVVHTKQEFVDMSCETDALALFLVIKCTAIYSQDLVKLIRDTKKTVTNRITPIFPTFATRSKDHFEPLSQKTQPVLNGVLLSSYKTFEPRRCVVSDMTVDSFEQKCDPIWCTTKMHPWNIYTDVAHQFKCEFDIEELITTPTTVLGRGGFGVTVAINDRLVAKTNLCPEKINWSVPFAQEEFDSCAHIASLVEEVMIGVSMKHPNILRTFGGYWCSSPGYQIGGRAVLVMERALCSLQEFVFYFNETSVVPAVELDTLRGLDYLRSIAIQHRDLTHRNILVCHQPNRRPIPFAFKISDFGSSCNFSTLDQPRGRGTTTAPEVLWCFASDTSSDIFSWYSVMWELHSGSPLVLYKAGPEKLYCPRTYAENLSNLVGVYTTTSDETLALDCMKAIDAQALHAKHKNKRPTVQMILENLKNMGSRIADKSFISMGVLCITLFPQERWSPSGLLKLGRYQCLSQDIGDALVAQEQIPSSLRLGDYKPTDIICSKDCVPEGLAATEPSQTMESHITVTKSDSKVYYGKDVFSLAPDLIQPYEWYSKKVKELQDVHRFRKRKTSDTYSCAKVKRSVPHDLKELLSVRSSVAHSRESSTVNPRGRVSEEEPLSRSGNLEWSNCNIIGSASSDSTGTLNSREVQLGFGPGDLVQGEIKGSVTAASVKDARLPRGVVIYRSRKIEGEMDTSMVILKSRNEEEIARFKNNVILLSQSMTQKHPFLFAGPRDGLYKCSKDDGVFVFQYAQLFHGCKQVCSWDTTDAPYTAHAFLLQVFLTLRAALEVQLLPMLTINLSDLLIGNGAVMIDVVSYLKNNFNEPPSSMFGNRCESLVGICTSLLTKHLPDSSLHKELWGLSLWTPASHVLTKSIDWLRNFEQSERTRPSILTLDGNCFTFRDYLFGIPKWLTRLGEEEQTCDRSSTGLLVYGHPKPFRGDQTAEGVDNAILKKLIRNIVLRMKVKVFGSTRLEVTVLNCTQGWMKVTLETSVLSGFPGIDQLDRLKILDGNCFTHDVASQTESKWAPVIKFAKCQQNGPEQEFVLHYYKMTILIVLLSPLGSVKSLRELFCNMPLSVTNY